MGLLISGGASIQCSFGAAPATLNVLPANKVLANTPIACMTDNVPMTNVLPFGMCSSMANPAVASATAAAQGVLTPQPCTPVIAAPWAPMLPTIMIGSTPAISTDSKLMCSYGGVIQIVSPGQTSIVAG